ncbi:hypothetical protein BJY04DRAFT_190917 [Aspergillus karnatakaensis]|uniref:uncharacterized protein n=1 Tax=Aspergillus karnatakaensis TaxID=1810916 RepID=UPI003CCD5530
MADSTIDFCLGNLAPSGTFFRSTTEEGRSQVWFVPVSHRWEPIRLSVSTPHTSSACRAWSESKLCALAIHIL